MNPTLRSLAAAGFLAAVSVCAADSFEGRVSFTITGHGHTQAMDYSMKGQALRIDLNAEGHQVSQIMDLSRHELTILMHQQHMYMVQPLPGIPAAGAADTAGQPDSGTGTAGLNKTGQTRQILGYTCHQVLVQDKDHTAELWLAEGLGTFMGLGGGNPMMGGRGTRTDHGGQWEQLLKGTGSFPLLVISRNASGKEVFRMEVTKITPASLPDTDFAAPADYHQLSIPGMGGMNPYRQG